MILIPTEKMSTQVTVLILNGKSPTDCGKVTRNNGTATVGGYGRLIIIKKGSNPLLQILSSYIKFIWKWLVALTEYLRSFTLHYLPFWS